MVVLPPVEPDLLGLVERADDEAYANREQLDFGQRDLYVACDEQALVQDTVQNVDEPGRARSFEEGLLGGHRGALASDRPSVQSGSAAGILPRSPRAVRV